VRFHDITSDAEAHAGSGNRFLDAFSAIETLEDGFNLVVAHTGAMIANLHFNEALGAGCPDFDGCFRRRVFDGVADKLTNRQSDHLRIGLDCRDPLGNVDQQRAAPQQILQVLDCRLDERGDVRSAAANARIPRLDARHVGCLVDHFPKLVRFLFNDGEELVLFLLMRVLGTNGGDGAFDGRQGGKKLVRQRIQKNSAQPLVFSRGLQAAERDLLAIAFQGRGCQVGQSLERRIGERGAGNADASKQGLPKCNGKDDKLRRIGSRRPSRSPGRVALRSLTEEVKLDTCVFLSSSEDFAAQRIAKQDGLKAELILEFFGNLQAGAAGGRLTW